MPCRPTSSKSRPRYSERPARASRFAPSSGTGEPPWDSEPLGGWGDEDDEEPVSREKMADIVLAMLEVTLVRMELLERRLLQAISRGSSGTETPDGDGGSG